MRLFVILLLAFTGQVFAQRSVIKVESPKANDVWEVGKTYMITWASPSFVKEVQIGLRDTRFDPLTLTDLSGGEAIIVDKIPNTGWYRFTVPESVEGIKGKLGGSSYQIIVYPYYGDGDLMCGTFNIVPKEEQKDLKPVFALGAVSGIILMLICIIFWKIKKIKSQT